MQPQPCLWWQLPLLYKIKDMRRLHEWAIPYSQHSIAYPQCHAHSSFSYLGKYEVSVWLFIWRYRCMFEKGSGGFQLGQLDHLESPRWGSYHHVNYWQSGIHQTGVGKLFQNAPKGETKSSELFRIKRTNSATCQKESRKRLYYPDNFLYHFAISTTQRKKLNLN